MVSRIVESYEGSSETYTINFTYDGTRLTRGVDSDGYQTSFSYQNDKLVGTQSTNGVDDSENISETYTYDAEGRLATITTSIAGFGTSMSNVAHSSNNTVVERLDPSNNDVIDRTTLSNENVVKFEEFDSNNNLSYQEDFTYGNMSSPFVNMDLRSDFLTISSENLSDVFYFNANNILTESYSDPNVPEFNSTSTYSYTFNEDGYPETITEVYAEDGFTETITYTLTYITIN